jgi:hypothetical protein
MAPAYLSLYERGYDVYAAIALIIGAWLCYAGRKSGAAAGTGEQS